MLSHASVAKAHCTNAQFCLGCTVRTSQAKKKNNLVKRFSVFILTCMYTLYGFFYFFYFRFLGWFLLLLGDGGV